MGLYADLERGKYPVWQSLDHKDFLPGSGILFVTVTVGRSVDHHKHEQPHPPPASSLWSTTFYINNWYMAFQGDYSKRVEALSDAQVQSEALAVLQLMFPNTSIPEPTAFFFPRWHSNPLFRGSYSNMPAAFIPTHQDNLRATVSDRLWFAGEATSFKYYGGLHFYYLFQWGISFISDTIL